MDCSPPGSSVHGILQARILEWVATFSFRGSSWPRDRTCISWISLHRQVNSLTLSYLGAQLVKNLPTMQEPQVQFLGQKDSLEKDRLATDVFLGFPGGSDDKESAPSAGDLSSIPRLGRFLEEGMATHTSIPAWRISMDRGTGRLQSMGSQKVKHDWATKHTDIPGKPETCI